MRCSSLIIVPFFTGGMRCRPVRSRNWSKEQLKGVMEAVISKYVQATNHQLYPQYDAEELEEQVFRVSCILKILF